MIIVYKMSMNHEVRSGFKWTVNECLRLEREYDLLKLSVDEIALLHQRSPLSIMYKLDSEGIAVFNELYQQTCPNKVSNKVFQDDDDDDDEAFQDDKKNDDASKSSDNEYDRYDLKQQIGLLTKQLSNLTAIVYKFLIKDTTKDDVLFH